MRERGEVRESVGVCGVPLGDSLICPFLVGRVKGDLGGLGVIYSEVQVELVVGGGDHVLKV